MKNLRRSGLIVVNLQSGQHRAKTIYAFAFVLGMIFAPLDLDQCKFWTSLQNSVKTRFGGE